MILISDSEDLALVKVEIRDSPNTTYCSEERVITITYVVRIDEHEDLDGDEFEENCKNMAIKLWDEKHDASLEEYLGEFYEKPVPTLEKIKYWMEVTVEKELSCVSENFYGHS